MSAAEGLAAPALLGPDDGVGGELKDEEGGQKR